MPIFDTHSHLFDDAFNDDREQCLIRLAQNDIWAMFVGYSKEANQKAYELAQRNPHHFSSAGIHPSEARDSYLEDLRELESFIKTHKVKALGEFGLDYYYDDAPSKDLQKSLFIAQMDLAVKYKLPVIIHTREAWQDTYDILKSYKGKVKGIIHCYSGSIEMANEFIKLGYFIAIGGAVTFKNARNVKQVAKEIDLNYLLVETDCPYITPVPFRGKRNESSYIIYTLNEISLLRNISLDELENITFKNACKIYEIEV